MSFKLTVQKHRKSN